MEPPMVPSNLPFKWPSPFLLLMHCQYPTQLLNPLFKLVIFLKALRAQLGWDWWNLPTMCVNPKSLFFQYSLAILKEEKVDWKYAAKKYQPYFREKSPLIEHVAQNKILIVGSCKYFQIQCPGGLRKSL